MERIALAREYRVAAWLRDAYFELTTQETPLNLEELRPAEPHYNPLIDRNWEVDAKKWEATSRDWETLARIFHLQTKVAASISSRTVRPPILYICDMGCGESYVDLCKCRLLSMVDEAFRGELESLRENPEHVDHPLPRELLISMFAVSVENNFV